MLLRLGCGADFGNGAWAWLHVFLLFNQNESIDQQLID